MDVDPPPFLNAAASAPAHGNSSTSFPSASSEGEGPSPTLPVDSLCSNPVAGEELSSTHLDAASSAVAELSLLSGSSSAPLLRKSTRSRTGPAGKREKARGEKAAKKAEAANLQVIPTAGKRKSDGGSVEGEKGAKKARAADTLAVPLPEGAPTWFKNALQMFQSNGVDLGEEWVGLLRIWAKFEGQAAYQPQGTLGTLHRPQVVKDWVKRARSATWRPIINDTTDLENSYRKWWASLQPAWRRFEDGAFASDLADGDWTELRKPGINGLLSVLAALFYWGLSVVGDSEVRQRWLLAVGDCTVVFNYLILI